MRHQILPLIEQNPNVKYLHFEHDEGIYYVCGIEDAKSNISQCNDPKAYFTNRNLLLEGKNIYETIMIDMWYKILTCRLVSYEIENETMTIIAM